ncbi:metal ABC transporter substrate-binding protein [Demequina sp.]|uniref:metal ABC transporter substrate-binding protein n=1 Tax=Demequina sp. TaxID=2050685 RepID=UPI0025FB7E82|nr:metal ABC transporter substrate-binding protein [Demequina sp.]
MRQSLIATAAATAAALSLAACAPGGSAADGSAGAEGPTVAAAFYPLEYVARAVAGGEATVIALAQPGLEAHDLELSPSAVRDVQGADLLLYLSEFQPAVDDAVSSTGVETLDAHAIVDEHGGAGEAADDGHDHGENDPHFWLDPTLLAEYGRQVADRLGVIDPDRAADYAANAAALEQTLTGIDEAYAAGLASCERDTIFVAHEAFGYLTERYGIHQEGFAGINPDAEPSPARLLEIKQLVAESGATVIFTENEVSARVADALASDVGVATAVLSPIETVTGDDDYAAVMNRNLDQIRSALACG